MTFPDYCKLQYAESFFGKSKEAIIDYACNGSLSLGISATEIPTLKIKNDATGEVSSILQLPTCGGMRFVYLPWGIIESWRDSILETGKIDITAPNSFRVFPVGHEKHESYEENHYSINWDSLEKWQRWYEEQESKAALSLQGQFHRIDIYLTLNAINSSQLFSQSMKIPSDLKIIEEFKDTQQITAAAKAIKAIEEVLLGRDYTQPQTGFYADTLKKVLIEKYPNGIPKEPTLNKHLEFERTRRGLMGVSLPRDSLRNMLAHIEQKIS